MEGRTRSEGGGTDTVRGRRDGHGQMEGDGHGQMEGRTRSEGGGTDTIRWRDGHNGGTDTVRWRDGQRDWPTSISVLR